MNKFFFIEKKIRQAINALGFDLHRLRPEITATSYLVKNLYSFKIDTVFDVGANTGQFTQGIRLAGFEGRVISFEPLSYAYAKLCENAKNDKNWIIHPRGALGDSNGNIKINIAGNSVSSSILDMMELHSNIAEDSAYVGTEDCKIQTLDNVAEQYISDDSKIFLKIDTQGYEWQVLDGAVKTLPHIRGIMLEASLVELYAGQRLWKDLVVRLEHEGFEVWSIDRVFSDPNTGKALQCDILFWRT